jgi:hypothetical protein
MNSNYAQNSMKTILQSFITCMDSKDDLRLLDKNKEELRPFFSKKTPAELQDDLLFTYFLAKYIFGYVLIIRSRIRDEEQRKALETLYTYITEILSLQFNSFDTMVKHKILQIIETPMGKDNLTYIVFLKKIAAGEVFIEPLDEKVFKLCHTLIRKNLEDDDIIKLYTVIDNCFTKEYCDEEDIRKGLYQEDVETCETAKGHMMEIGEMLMTGRKIYTISSLDGYSDIAETTYNLDVYIIDSLCNRLKIADELDTPNKSDNIKNATEELRLTVLHELAHIKRIKYSAKNNFFGKSPKKFNEIGNWLEDKLKAEKLDVNTVLNFSNIPSTSTKSQLPYFRVTCAAAKAKDTVSFFKSVEEMFGDELD